MEHWSDEQLLAQAPRDEAAFEALMRRHLPRVQVLAESLVGRGAADDVVQEVLVSVHRSLRSFRGDAQFSTWLHRVALNACYRALRKKPSLPLEEVPDLVAPGDPVHAGEIADLRARLAWAFAQLPTDQRDAVALRELSGLEYLEIAQVLGVELGTVKSRIARGRQALKKLLIKEGVTP